MAQVRPIVVLSGATRGLGRALVDELARRGCTVVGCGRSEHAVASLQELFPPPHRFEAIDVADWPQAHRWAEDALGALAPPDLLINNAGLMNNPRPLWQVPAEELAAVMRVNVEGTANVIRAFVPAMIAAGRGFIVNMSSGWGRITAPDVAPYCASKWAVEGLTKALAQELPAGLATAAVNPGIIDTDMLRTCWADEAGGFPSPEEWAAYAAPFLLDLSIRDNGRSLTIDSPG
jgi:NAD(P)-dependent dehydrogenase (short-subunit alcohol dehydrogenase family)